MIWPVLAILPSPLCSRDLTQAATSKTKSATVCQMTLMAGYYPGSAYRMHSSFGEIWGFLPRVTLAMTDGVVPIAAYGSRLPLFRSGAGQLYHRQRHTD